MNTKEAMQALLDGKKITFDNWSVDSYMHLVDGVLRYSNGYRAVLPVSSNCRIYEPPKRKVKRTMYQFIYSTGFGHVYMTQGLFYNENGFNAAYNNCKIIKAIEHEIEVEDE